MSYEPRFDLVLPDWPDDLVYGEAGEEFVKSLSGRTVEVKRKRYLDVSFYLETEQSARRNGYKPSGLATTEADFWAFVIADSGIVVLFPRQLLARSCSFGRMAKEDDGDNPTRGWLVAFGQILEAARPTSEERLRFTREGGTK